MPSVSLRMRIPSPCQMMVSPISRSRSSFQRSMMVLNDGTENLRAQLHSSPRDSHIRYSQRLPFESALFREYPNEADSFRIDDTVCPFLRLGSCFKVILLLAILTRGELWASSNTLLLRLEPISASPVVGILEPGEPFFMVSLHDSWVQVSQGPIRGWLPLDRFWSLIIPKVADPLPTESNHDPAKRFFYFGSAPSRGEGLQSLLDSAAETTERTQEMSHPSHRDRIGAVSAEWGPFYYRRTHHYYYGDESYDLTKDPLELVNLIGKKSEGTDKLRRLMDAWQDDCQRHFEDLGVIPGNRNFEQLPPKEMVG